MPITNGYVTLAEVKSALRITDAIDDVRLEACIQRASRWVDQQTGRFFFQRSGTYDFTVINPYKVRITDLATATGLTVTSDDNNDNTFTSTWEYNVDYRLEPTEAPAYGFPFNFLVSQDAEWIPDTRVRVVGTFGWPSIPDPVAEATLLLSIRLFKRPDAPLGVAGFGELGAVMVRGSDLDARNLLLPYMRVAVA
jgi:hypothetical protein